ncbi:MAG: pre-peptidase C-terminal domain-containing protein [Planctomycetota bacterium]|nr:pre-peptidase C-terminal domain-containing protein [Planctomycetota bacterium]
MAWRADCPHCRAEARDSTGPGTGIDPTTARRRLPRIAPDPTPTAPAGGAAGVGKRGGGGIAVFLDFTDFETRLGELASDAGVDAFTAGEVTQLQDGIQTGMETVYAEFTVSFSQADPGGTFETVRFGDTDPTPNLLGIADGFPDYRNINGNDVGHVFTANFFGSVNEFTGGEDREEQLRQLTVALYGTAAHELGHNLGLQHYDPYGSPLLRDPDDTGEAQNVHIMATGSTGLGEAARESPRTLSRLSKVKLEFSNGLTAAPQATTDEQVAGHGTPATAQALALADLPISGVRAANVLGAVAVADELDVYSFTAQAGQLITLNTMSDTQSLNLPGYADPVDTVLSLFDTDGTTLLASNDDIRYDFTTIGTGTTYYNQDSLIVNFTAPATGTYYAQVAGFDSSETGNYELLVSVGDPSPVNYDPDLNLVSVDGRDGEDDTVVLSRTGIALYVDWNGTRYTLFTNFEPVDEIEVATLGGDDLLRVDFSGGDSPIPDDGIGYDGGTNGATGDRLVVEQGAATALTHAFTGPASGSIGVDGAIVAYVNVEPAVTLDMTADELTFTLTGGGDDALLSDDATAGDGFSSLRGVAGGLSVIFSMPATSLTLNGGAGDDTLVLEGLDADYVGSGVAVALNGGADDDAFTLDWSGGVLDLPLTLAGGAGENTLEALGDGALDLTYRPDAATPGSGTLDLGATNLPAFSGMASLDLSGFDALKLITPGDADDLTLANPQAGMGTVSGSSGGVDFAPFSFRETASLALDAAANDAGGDDTVMLGTDLAPGFGGTVTLQQLIVLTGSGHDTVTAGLSPTTALDLDAGDPAGPASPGDVLVFEPRGLGALDAGGPPPADGSISAPGHMALAYQRFEELVTADSRSLKIQSLRYAVSFVKRALGLGENVDSFSASGVLNAADFAAQGIDTATFAGNRSRWTCRGRPSRWARRCWRTGEPRRGSSKTGRRTCA